MTKQLRALVSQETADILTEGKTEVKKAVRNVLQVTIIRQPCDRVVSKKEEYLYFTKQGYLNLACSKLIKEAMEHSWSDETVSFTIKQEVLLTCKGEEFAEVHNGS